MQAEAWLGGGDRMGSPFPCNSVGQKHAIFSGKTHKSDGFAPLDHSIEMMMGLAVCGAFLKATVSRLTRSRVDSDIVLNSFLPLIVTHCFKFP